MRGISVKFVRGCSVKNGSYAALLPVWNLGNESSTYHTAPLRPLKRDESLIYSYDTPLERSTGAVEVAEFAWDEKDTSRLLQCEIRVVALCLLANQPLKRGRPRGEHARRCLLCGYTTSHISNMKDHLRIHTGECPYKCSYCGKAFRQKCNLATHIRIHTGERPFQCYLCPRDFVQNEHLLRHLKTHKGKHLSPDGAPT